MKSTNCTRKTWLRDHVTAKNVIHALQKQLVGLFLVLVTCKQQMHGNQSKEKDNRIAPFNHVQYGAFQIPEAMRFGADISTSSSVRS